jgi:hypothetical protein
MTGIIFFAENIRGTQFFAENFGGGILFSVGVSNSNFLYKFHKKMIKNIIFKILLEVTYN